MGVRDRVSRWQHQSQFHYLTYSVAFGLADIGCCTYMQKVGRTIPGFSEVARQELLVFRGGTTTTLVTG